MKLYQFTILSGVSTFILLSATLFTGLRRWDVETHEHLALLTLVLGAIHASTYVYRKIKSK